VTPSGDLASLLQTGEHAAFHGKPAAAVSSLEQAVVLAQAQGRSAEVAAAAWLLGVALGAGGRYGGALTVLGPLVESGAGERAGPERRLFASLAGSTLASVHRQLGRHTFAREADLTALQLTDGTSSEAAFDALLGLASDAVGLDEADEAVVRLAAAAAIVPRGLGGEWWRQRVRLGWTEAELALLEGRADEAVVRARTAVERAEQARAPRHVAKGLLIQGLAEVSGGSEEAVVTLRRAATLAESLGTLPLVWPARALLGALVEQSDPQESARSIAAAQSAVRIIGNDLPDTLRAGWLNRPDVVALLGS
jgi:hypothetical protein